MASKIVDIRVKCEQDNPLYVSISDLRPGDIVISGTMWQPEWGYCTVGSDDVFRVVAVPEEAALEAIELEASAYRDMNIQFGYLSVAPQTRIGRTLEREIVFRRRLVYRLDKTTNALRGIAGHTNNQYLIDICDTNSGLLAEIQAVQDKYNQSISDYLESLSADQADYDETIASFEAGTGRM